jgi:DNA replication and repair protein RecF
MLKKLSLHHFRNISTLAFDFSAKFNLFYGENGSGKTSILEAIHVLTQGKSFRTMSNEQLIQESFTNTVLFGIFEDADGAFQIGLEKTLETTLIKINGEKQKNTVALLRKIPVIVVNPESYDLIEAGPETRRQFLNWGMFHVEHDFEKVWKLFNRCLKQRNAGIRAEQAIEVWQSWDVALSEAGELFTQMRKSYIQALEPYFQQLISQLPFPHKLVMAFYQGWAEELPLFEALRSRTQRDLAQGFTTTGPQKADIIFNIKNAPAEARLSRGQEKLAVSVLRLAQGLMLFEKTGKTSIYLLDDLAAELDSLRRKALLKLCEQIPGQFFISSTDRNTFEEEVLPNSTMFHVEH